MMSRVVFGRSLAAKLQISFEPGLIEMMGARRVRCDWNRVAGIFRIQTDDAGRYELSRFAKGGRYFVRLPFPEGDLYAVAGSHPAEHRLVADGRQLLVKVAAAFLEQPPAPAPIAAPAQAPVEPVALLAPPRAEEDDEQPPGRQWRSLRDVTFTATEAAILGVFAKRQLVTRSMILTASWDPTKAEDDDREEKLADVLLSKLRPRLEKLGLLVRLERGQGWFLNTADRQRLTVMIVEAEEALQS